MRSHFILSPILLIIAYCPAFSQTPISDPRAKQACASVEQVEPPAADRPTAAEEKALASCVSLDAYYGLGEAADPVKARKCAFAEMDRGTKSALSGKAILSMVYANGKGVERNYDVALKMACTIGDAPGDAAEVDLPHEDLILLVRLDHPAGDAEAHQSPSSGRFSARDRRGVAVEIDLRRLSLIDDHADHRENAPYQEQ